MSKEHSFCNEHETFNVSKTVKNRPVPQLWMARAAGQWAAHGDSVYYLPLLTGVMSPPNALLSMRRNFKVVTGFCFMPWERLEFPEYQKSIQSQCMRIALPESSRQVSILYSWRGLERPRLKFCDLQDEKRGNVVSYEKKWNTIYMKTICIMNKIIIRKIKT